ncbi:phospholipid/cholesterol/gamma-HCH transport system ATP-binding protein [Fodinibius salinus]|uniref:Phospholipid/cholesterol/gamma-HCH transport system ATP-binding protein n=1 Tax=Fodinibius salinus TaxID=860790 RepID=A0A5D3YP53_9BACT|nr:ATP-binding cassette domain-containing protein [Fodinibius salinus]TYP93939.1 phospholipid/cholesterol/gamma-HCH transport system ATP-binding protein [Fodinibius salinus]
MIEIRNLTKSFGSNLVWEDVSFNIEEGETVAIIGRSGCGKSVLVKHLNALMYPDSGEVIIDGRNVFDLEYVALRKMRQRFGVLFQGSALFDSLNTFENIAFPLEYFTDLTEDEIADKVEESLDLVNLAGTGDQSPAELSGGMQRRVALARATILEPDFLIYDEPTSGLDPKTSEEINELIISMAQNLNITSIVVTHDIHSVLEIAERVVFLENENLSWHGTVDEMRESDNEDLMNFITASEYQIRN